jgi:drug/metabolite transporter (DMT)-like permease
MLQKQVTSTTMLIIINMNKFIVVLYGLSFRGEDHSTPVVIGSIIALLGGLWYGFAVSRLHDRRKALAAAEKGDVTEPPQDTSCASTACDMLDRDLC